VSVFSLERILRFGILQIVFLFFFFFLYEHSLLRSFEFDVYLKAGCCVRFGL